MVSGVYKIFSLLEPSKNYVGSSINIEKRIRGHIQTIISGKHNNKKMMRYFQKYGIDNLSYEVLEYCEPNKLLDKENYYLSEINPYFNWLKTAYSLLGYKHSEEAKLKIKTKNTGRKMTEEQIRKGVISRIGQRTSKGCKRTEEMRKHLSNVKKKKVVYNEKIYDCLGDLSLELNIKYSTLYAMLSNKNFNRLNIKFHA